MSIKELPFQVLARGEAPPMWFLGVLTLMRATAETTGGAFALVEQVIPAGFSSPFHVHHAEDEAFYIIEGELAFFSQGEKLRAGPGGYIFGPRGIAHGFRVEGTNPARVLFLVTPGGGFDRFVIEMSGPAPDAPPDIERLIAVAAKYQIEILGPLPE